jgi:uncharacterized protein YjiS (DUF1127 family)
MASIALRHPEATLLYRLARFMQRNVERLCVAARRLDIWLERRRALAAARHDLHQLSEYELRDIGLRSWDIEAVARGKSPRAADDAQT